MNKYSVTSNEAKLLKHLNNLKSIQDGKAKPIMIHISTTNVCNQTCKHCCFDDRDKKLVMPFETFSKALLDFKLIGVKAFEFTGGGEPTLYPFINEAIDLGAHYNMKMGINTNGVAIDNIKKWESFSWVRVSLNVFDLNDENKIKNFKKSVDFIKDKTDVSACYIVSKDVSDFNNLKNVIDFANEHKVTTRIAPDCIQKPEDIIKLIEVIKNYLNVYSSEKENTFAFCSDFNVYLNERPNNFCAVHMIKPFLFTDGWVYSCPSFELATENGKKVSDKFRVCKAEDIFDYYTNSFEIFERTCSYCKYAKQNEMLNFILMETQHNEFA